jgi:hypothetical protein
MLCTAPVACAQDTNVEINLDVLDTLSGSRYAPDKGTTPIRLRPPGSAPVRPKQVGGDALPVEQDLPPTEDAGMKVEIFHGPVTPMPGEKGLTPLNKNKDDSDLPKKKTRSRVVLKPEAVPAPSGDNPDSFAEQYKQPLPVLETKGSALPVNKGVEFTQEIFKYPAAGPSVPIPPHRPRIINASKSFLEKARANVSAEKAPNTKPKSIEKKSKNADLERDYLNSKLENPTAEEVLASIDSSAGGKESATTKNHAGSEEMPQGAAAPLGAVDNIVSLGYLPGISQLPEKLKPDLEEEIDSRRKGKRGVRIEIQAYASGTDNSQSSARRISLARALELRSFMIAMNIDPRSIDIRALGDNTDIKPTDRVDIVFGSGYSQ